MMEDMPSEYSEGIEQLGKCKCSVDLTSHHTTTCEGSTHKKSSHEQTTHNWDRALHDKPMCDRFPAHNPPAPEEPSHTHHCETSLHTNPAGQPKAQCVNTVHGPTPLPSSSKATGLSDRTTFTIIFEVVWTNTCSFTKGEGTTIPSLQHSRHWHF